MPRNYFHLTPQDRAVFILMRGDQYGIRSIAKHLGRSASMISREFKRLDATGVYDANQAQTLALRGKHPKLPKLGVPGDRPALTGAAVHRSASEQALPDAADRRRIAVMHAVPHTTTRHHAPYRHVLMLFVLMFLALQLLGAGSHSHAYTDSHDDCAACVVAHLPAGVPPPAALVVPAAMLIAPAPVLPLAVAVLPRGAWLTPPSHGPPARGSNASTASA